MAKKKPPELLVEKSGVSLEAERARRYRAHLSVLLVDIDGLRVLRKSLGDEGTIELVHAVADAIRARLRKIDVFGRWEPEDFIVLTVDSNPYGAIAAAERLRRVVEQSQFTIKGKSVKVTVSIGVASGVPREEAQVDAILEAARKALLKAKASGRNKVEFNAVDLAHLPAREEPRE